MKITDAIHQQCMRIDTTKESILIRSANLSNRLAMISTSAELRDQRVQVKLLDQELTALRNLTRALGREFTALNLLKEKKHNGIVRV